MSYYKVAALAPEKSFLFKRKRQVLKLNNSLQKKIFLFSLILILHYFPGFRLTPVLRAAEAVLQLRWHHQFQFAGYYMALEKNYYADRGLSVKIKALTRDIHPVTEVITGRADFGIGSTGLLLERNSGKPVVALAAIFQHSPLVFIAPKKSGITKIKDLKGKRVMIAQGNQDFELVVLLEKTKMIDHVTLLPSSTDVLDLARGRTDVFNAYLSNEPYVLETRGIPVSVIDPKDYGIDFYGDILFTSESLIEKNPSMVENFRQASLMGWRYALQHPEETIEIIKKKYRSKKSKSELRYEENIIRELMLSDIVEIGHMNQRRFKSILKDLAALGTLKQNFPLQSFIYSPPRKIQWKKIIPWAVPAGILLAAFIIFTIIQVQTGRRLRKALHEVKTIRGLLPICASCKKIRDDSGYWQQIESYISLHSDADFSHSLCPGCAETLYPDIDYSEMGKEKKDNSEKGS